MSKRKSASVRSAMLPTLVVVVTLLGSCAADSEGSEAAAPVSKSQAIEAATAALPSPPPEFPTVASTGVAKGARLKRWNTAIDTTSEADLPTTQVNGVKYKLIDSYLFDVGTSGRFLAVDDPYVIIRNSRFETGGEVSNTGAMVQGQESNKLLIIERSEFNGGPKFQRGVQSDSSDMLIIQSRFQNTGEAAIEKNDRAAQSWLVVSESYFSNEKGWPKSQHVDGIQVGGASSVTILHNTVLNQLYGGTEGDTDYVSNSALGLWAELGDVGPVTVENNLLAGGGVAVYLESKEAFAWTGPVKFRNNTFDTRFGPKAAIWGQLSPNGLPKNLTWTGNHFRGGKAISLVSAVAQT